MSSPGKIRVYEATCCDRVQSLWRAFSSSHGLITLIHQLNGKTQPDFTPETTNFSPLSLMPLNDFPLISLCQHCVMICFDLNKQLTRLPWDIDLTPTWTVLKLPCYLKHAAILCNLKGDFRYPCGNKNYFYFMFHRLDFCQPQCDHFRKRITSVIRSFLLSVLHKSRHPIRRLLNSPSVWILCYDWSKGVNEL